MQRWLLFAYKRMPLTPHPTPQVLRRKATEPRKVTVSKGGWDDHFAKGTYVCTGCKTPLYTSEMKFDCGCGWPVRRRVR